MRPRPCIFPPACLAKTLNLRRGRNLRQVGSSLGMGSGSSCICGLQFWVFGGFLKVSSYCSYSRQTPAEVAVDEMQMSLLVHGIAVHAHLLLSLACSVLVAGWVRIAGRIPTCWFGPA